MEFRCIFAGFGGQGIISMGTLLAYAATTAGRQTTFFPAYGIAMRGGTANCTVVVSDAEIASPVIFNPNVLVVMNQLSLDHFQSWLEPGGYLFVNSTLIQKKAARTDVTPFYVNATGLAVEGGDARMANMAMLGAIMKGTGMLPLDPLGKAIEKTFPPKIAHLAGKNKAVLEAGFRSV